MRTVEDTEPSALVSGIAAAHAEDEARLARGAALFDDLYAVHAEGTTH